MRSGGLKNGTSAVEAYSTESRRSTGGSWILDLDGHQIERDTGLRLVSAAKKDSELVEEH